MSNGSVLYFDRRVCLTSFDRYDHIKTGLESSPDTNFKKSMS